jgi:CRISPR/Cas system-associated exonuclease Cas4 (RecB family)
MLVMLKAAAPVFVSVAACGELLVPTNWFPNDNELGDRVTVDTIPVPVKATVCGLPLALSFTVSVPVLAPVAVGVKVTLMVQVAPAATLVPQVLV